MKIYLNIEAIDEPYFGGASAALQFKVYRTEEEAVHALGITIPVELEDLNKNQMNPSFGAEPTNNKKGTHDKWIVENREWLNAVCDHFGYARGMTTDEWRERNVQMIKKVVAKRKDK